jgi:ABC-type glutathione transport system ATPase component
MRPAANDATPGTPLLELHDIRKEYVLRRGFIERLTKPARVVAAVDGVSLSVARGSVFGLVGESGSGKSTLAQIIVRLIEPTDGCMFYDGKEVGTLPAAERQALRHRIQMVFQDAYSSLNPRKRIRRALREPLRARGAEKRRVGEEIERLMQQVGLDPVLLGRFPHELSGGQRQRVGIARALAMSPELLIADEPVSSLDVSLQGQIINLLQDLNRDLGLTIVLISHDLAVVARVCSNIAVMSAGLVVETGPPARVLVTPSHPYTKTLIAAIPRGLEGRRSKTAPSATSIAEPAYAIGAE